MVSGMEEIDGGKIGDVVRDVWERGAHRLF